MRNHGPENVLLSSVVILSLLLFHISKTVSRGDRLSGDANTTDPSGEAHKPPGAKKLFKIPLKFNASPRPGLTETPRGSLFTNAAQPVPTC